MATLNETDAVTAIALLKQYRKRLEIDQQYYAFGDIMEACARIDMEKIDGLLAHLEPQDVKPE